MLRLLNLGFLLFAASASAADTGLLQCAGIDDDSQRLACYDALSGRSTQSEAAMPTSGQTAKPEASPAAAAAIPSAAPTTAVDATARFGAEQLPRPAKEDEEEPDRIESYLPGRFEGWTADSVFALENGQIWRCVNCRDVYYVRDHPKVVIERSFIGGYWLKVEGLNRQARVRRVK